MKIITQCRGQLPLQKLKFDLKMKLSAMFIAIVLFQVNANESYSQGAKITMDLEGATVGEAMEKIEDITDFRFLYSRPEIDLDRKVTLKAQKKSIQYILRSLFRSTGTTFAINANQIVLRTKSGKKLAIAAEMPPPAPDIVQRTITGTVTDENGAPLPGASIVEKGTSNGTQTDFDGNFSIDVTDDNAVLVISYIGFATKEIAVNNQSNIGVTLQADTAGLDEVVVIGYGSVKRRDLTGSVASVQAEEIVKVPTARIDDALRGRVAGLQIVSSGGNPGANNTIRIRGSNSLAANNEPLVVIDGFIGGGDINSINTNDIQSVDVLKDASALAIYGARGANGVIVITTKRGRVNQEPQITYSSYVSSEQIADQIDPLSREEYIAVQDIANPGRNYGDANTDWADLILKNGFTTENTVSVAGGSEKTQYYLSANYFRREGNVVNDLFKRYQVRLNLDTKIGNHIKIGTTTSLSRIESDGAGIGTGDVFYDPTIPVRDENGDFFIQDFTNSNPDNPVSRTSQLIRDNRTNRVLTNLFAEIDLFDGLSFKASAAVDATFFKEIEFTPSTLGSQILLNRTGEANLRSDETFNFLTEYTLNYNKTFGDHSINAVLGYTQQTNEYERLDADGRNFVSDIFTYNDLGGAQNQPVLDDEGNLQSIIDNSIVDSAGNDWAIESFLARANYTYKNKYLFTFSGRYDGSSRFAANNKRAFFPSGAFSWRVSEEPFMKDSPIKNLKFRASYGSIGNQAIGLFQSLARLGTSNSIGVLGLNRDFGYIFDGAVQTGFGPTSIDNPDLTWETTTSLDLGVDFGLFNNALNVTFDYYNKKTTDLLVVVPIADFTGFTSTLRNFGSIRNTGFELVLNSLNVNTENFTWETTLNISRNRNEVLTLANPEGEIPVLQGYNGLGQQTFGLLRVGEPIGVFYGLTRDGIWNDQAEIDAAPNELGTNTGAQPGFKRYVDVNEDGFIDDEDRDIIGDPNPDFFGGIDNTFTYKDFDLSVFFQFSVGNDINNYGANSSLDRRELVLDAWSETNTTSNSPSIRDLQNTSFFPDDTWIEDGSFLRLRTLSLGYNLPVETINFVRNARIYATATNLFTITGYSGINPDVSSDGADSNLARGFDRNDFPFIRTFTLGINVNF